MVHKNFQELKKNLKKNTAGFPVVKLAVLGDSATQLLTQALKGCGVEYAYNLEIWEADYNQIERQLLDPSSELYAFQPDFIFIFHSTHKLLQTYNKAVSADQSLLADERIKLIQRLVHAVESNIQAKIIYCNYNEIDDSIFGNFANKLVSSFLFQVRKLNFSLMTFASQHPGLYICDLASIQNSIGKCSLFMPSMYINTEMVLSLEALPLVAYKTLQLITTLQGKFKKCLIVDLDNTMWGGIIGDDGIENIQIGNLGIGKAFTEFQYWIKKLKARGIIIAVCSKNTESIAKKPFEDHPDMVLRLEDIAVFVANWENKADNIRFIQSILNIGFDSMVFLDDNPFERNLVRENIPDITVPELPEDPSEYLEYLYSLNLFETASYTNQDAERTKQYQVESARTQFKQSFTDESQFLQSLEMESLVEPFTKFNIPRVAQLTQRSNQYNLRTIRYTEADIENLSLSPNHFPFTFTLEDKFGDNGLICVVILKKENETELFIDTWLMSCRVLKRGMEHFVLSTLIDFSKEHGFSLLKGEYIPTSKNELVKDHYEYLGFEKTGEQWSLNVHNYSVKDFHIKNKTTIPWEKA